MNNSKFRSAIFGLFSVCALAACAPNEVKKPPTLNGYQIMDPTLIRVLQVDNRGMVVLNKEGDPVTVGFIPANMIAEENYGAADQYTCTTRAPAAVVPGGQVLAEQAMVVACQLRGAGIKAVLDVMFRGGIAVATVLTAGADFKAAGNPAQTYYNLTNGVGVGVDVDTKANASANQESPKPPSPKNPGGCTKPAGGCNR